MYTFDVPLTATKLVAKVKQTTREEGEDVTSYVLLKWYVTCAIKSASGQVLAEGDRQLVLNETGDYNSGSEKAFPISMEARADGTGTQYVCDLTPGSPQEFGTHVSSGVILGSQSNPYADVLSATSGDKEIKGTGSFAIKKPPSALP